MSDGCSFGTYTRGALWVMMSVIGLVLTGIGWYTADTRDYADNVKKELTQQIETQVKQNRNQALLSARLEERVIRVQSDIQEIKQLLSSENKFQRRSQ